MTQDALDRLPQITRYPQRPGSRHPVRERALQVVVGLDVPTRFTTGPGKSRAQGEQHE